MPSEKAIGVILSLASSREASCQLLESAEKGKITEGMLVLVESSTKILARVAQIVPYNAFYTEGDPWSEARRKGLRIPEEVARRYEVCKIELLTELPRNEIKYPPQPGDSVFKLDPTANLRQIFGVSPDESVSNEGGSHVWYGTLAGYANMPVPLKIEAIPMHMAVFGTTGSGKSFDTGALIEELCTIPVRNKAKDNEHVSYPMIIIDAHGDYTDYVIHAGQGKKLGRIAWIRRYVFPSAHTIEHRGKGSLVFPLAINLDLLPQREVAEIIMLYSKGTIEGAEQQINGIDNLLDWMRDQHSYQSAHDIFESHLDELITELESDQFHQATQISGMTVGAIRRALEEFRKIEDQLKLLSTKSDLKEKQFIKDLTGSGGIAVVDFSADGAPGIDLRTKQLVMTYVASVVFGQFTEFKVQKQDRYLLFAIEEAQNFAPDRSYPVGSSLAHQKLSAIATQGRKFGVSLCLISQRPSFVDKIVVSMCNSFFIHRISPEDISFVKNVTGGLPDSLARRLTNLDRGEMILAGQMNTVPFPLDIRIPRRDVPHTVGKTAVVQNLAKLRDVK